MIIDAHIHLNPPSQFPTAGADYLATYPPYRRLCYSPTPYNHTRQGYATCEQMIAAMDEAGIDKVVALGNDEHYQIECLNRYPDRIVCFLRLNLVTLRSDLKGQLARMRHFIRQEGFLGFGEFHPDMAGNDLYSREMQAVAELALELSVPINLHVSESVGHFYYGKSHNGLDEYYWLAKRYPDLKMILAHWGGGLCFYEAIPEIRATLQNVYYDTTASRLFFDVRKSMEQITQIVDPRKLFYGSDYPILLHPREHPDDLDPRFIWDRDEFLQAHIPADVLNGVMGDNFARFLGLLHIRSG